MHHLCGYLYFASEHFAAYLLTFCYCTLQISSELCNKWNSIVKEEHIGLQTYMTAFATKAVLRCVLGEGLFSSDKEVLAFMRNYEQVSKFIPSLKRINEFQCAMVMLHLLNVSKMIFAFALSNDWTLVKDSV